MLTNFRSRTPAWRYRRAPYGFLLFRVCWETGTPGDGVGYSSKLSLAMSPNWFRVLTWERDDKELYLLGLRVHHRRSYGGRFG